MSYIFLSYSRRQLYFAESLVLHLQKAGLEIWFDLQKLTPGIDWPSTLEAGYSNCERLILVASQAAIGSEYVEKEWHTALANGCEVILVVVEPLIIPEALRGCPTYDFQSRFDQKLNQLLSYLRGEGAARQDPIPVPGRLGLQWKMPFDVWLTILTLVMPELGLLITMAAFASSSLAGLFMISGEVIPVFAFFLFFAWLARKFWRHNYDYETLKNGAPVVIGFQLLSSITCFIIAVLGLALFGNPILYLTSFFVAYPVASIYWYRQYKRSEDILRWYPTGLASQEMRAVVTKKLMTQEVAPSAQIQADGQLPNTVTYALHYHPADAPFASFLEKALIQAGQLAASSKEAMKQIVIVSNRTSLQWLEEFDAIDNGSNIIYVLASSISLSPRLERMRKKQWVDLRKCEEATTLAFAKNLAGTTQLNREYAAQVAPIRFEDTVLPGNVQASLPFAIVGLFAIIPFSFVLIKEHWLTILISSVVAIYLLVKLDRVYARRAALPSFLKPFLYVLFQTDLVWFAAQAPYSPDSIGVQKKSKVRGWRWFR